jgi:hypothetical protein
MPGDGLRFTHVSREPICNTRHGTVNLLADVRPNTRYVRIANLSDKALQHRSARHAFPRLDDLGA